MILRYATLNPLFLDTSPLPPLSDDLRIPDVGSIGHFNCGNILTKRSVVLVSKLWQSLAIEFLYEWILIEAAKPESVDALLRAFETGAESPGRYVRRLALHFNQWSIGPSAADRLNSILHKCHGLQALEIIGTQRNPPDLSIILDRVASVRYFKITWTRNNQSPTDFIPLFSNLSRLQSLESMDFYWCNNWGDFPSEKVTFPRLHTMGLGTQGGDPKNVLDKIASNWELPALRSLSIDPAYSRESLTPILKAHGHRLTTVHTGIGSPNMLLTLIAAFCPSVEAVSVQVEQWGGDEDETNEAPATATAHPTVLSQIRLIRVEGVTLPQQASLVLDRLLRFIFKMTTPNLLSIQLKEFPANYPINGLPTRWLPKSWRKWETEFLEKGIRFEDRHRMVINPADVEFADE
jgi:hypothetical protein